MIDFKQVIKDNISFTEFSKVQNSIIDPIEQRLKKQIENNPDKSTWCEVYKANISQQKMKELYNFIVEEFVNKNKTQMTVVFSPEVDHGEMFYFPAEIIFSVSKKDLK